MDPKLKATGVNATDELLKSPSDASHPSCAEGVRLKIYTLCFICTVSESLAVGFFFSLTHDD